MVTLDDLPADILVLILHSLDSPRDLHALIAASPSCLAVFLPIRNRVLTSVLKNAIPPGALYHALATASAPHPLVGAADSPRRSPVPDLDTAKSLLDTYFSGKPIEFPKDTAGLVALCRLYSLVSRFSNEYLGRAMHLLTADAGGSVVLETRPVSLTEWTRVYRAFFRYELFCRLFPPAYKQDEDKVSIRERFEIFITEMDSWEVEEMSCVHSHLIHLIEDFIKDLEAQMMDAVFSSEGVWDIEGLGEPPDNAQSESPRSEDLVLFDDLELRGLSLYAEANKRQVPRFMAQLAAYGLEFIAKLQRASPRDLRDFIRAEDLSPRSCFADNLGNGPRDQVRAPCRIIVRAGVPPDVGRSNMGYSMHWPGPTNYARYHCIFHGRWEFEWEPGREHAYAFWDDARCREPDFNDRLEKACLAARPKTAGGRPRGWATRKTVERRLAGVRLRRGEMQRIIREFSEWHGEQDGPDVEL